MTKPAMSGTAHTLPFDQLSPRDFERLCLWLVRREGYEEAEHLGAAGSEQGRDLVAWREGRQWAFQCKRVQSFGPTRAVEEIDKLTQLSAEERPVGLIFLVTCDVSARTRQKARKRCAEIGLACGFWASTEFDEKVKRHPDIVREFFQAGMAQAPGGLTGAKPGVVGGQEVQPRGLVLWGKLPFPLADRVPTDRRRGRLDDLPATYDPGGTEAEWLPSLPPVPILSLDPGDRVERAFEAAGVPLKVVRTRRDAPARDRHSLLKLAGDLGSRGGVVLSRAEIRELRNDAENGYLLDEAMRAVEGGALLMVGCDPADGDFGAWWKVLAPTFRGADLYALGEPSAPWPEGVEGLGSDLEAARAVLKEAGLDGDAAVSPGPPQPLSWLHLSDLHFRAATAYDEEIVLRALLQDLRDGEVGPDFIVVSGDIAFSGKAREYAMARAFFDELLRTTGVAKERLFLVPGNHDVDRDLISRGARGIAASLTDRASANAVLGNDADRQLMMARFEGYAAFVNDYFDGCPPFDDEGYFYVQKLEIGTRPVTLLGLNSAWLAQGDEDRNRLLIGERQTRAALDRAGDAGLKIALLHHPFDWLRDFDRGDSEAMLTDNVDFVLHGHMHQVGLLQARGPDSNAMIIAAGACYESREHPNAYNLVQLDLGRGQGKVHLRTYSDKRGGFWTKDVMNYRNVPDGVYEFTFAPVAGEPVRPAPTPRKRRKPPRREVRQDPEPPRYNISAVRDLLVAGFTTGDLRRLVMYASNPALQQLTNEFSSSDGLNTMVEKTITHCRNKDCMADLLAEVKEANPRQYARFEPSLLA